MLSLSAAYYNIGLLQGSMDMLLRHPDYPGIKERAQDVLDEVTENVRKRVYEGREP